MIVFYGFEQIRLDVSLMFMVQVVLLPKLTKEEYIWLSRLRPNLKTDDAERLSGLQIG